MIPAVCAVLVCAHAAASDRPFGSVISASSDEITAPRAEAPTDLYGNEVRQAIARYKVDPGGVVYEEHSPDTELPRLPSPKS